MYLIVSRSTRTFTLINPVITVRHCVLLYQTHALHLQLRGDRVNRSGARARAQNDLRSAPPGPVVPVRSGTWKLNGVVVVVVVHV